MTHAEKLNAANAKAMEALTKAREISKKMDENPSEASTYEEQFKNLTAAFTAATNEAARIKSQQDVDEQWEKFQKPAGEERLRASGVNPSDETFQKFHKDTFRLYMSKGEAYASARLATGPREAHALLGSQDDLGGFLVPEDFRQEVVKDLAGMATFRSAGARVVATNRQTVVWPSIASNTGSYSDMYTSGFAGTWRNEGEQGTDGSAPSTQNQPTFGQERINIHVWQPAAVILTQEFLEDSAVPVESVLAELIAETKALDEDYEFINGVGVTGPEGILSASANVATVDSGDASLLTYGGLVDLWSTLPSQYRQRSSWLMNSLTFGAILKLESAAGYNLFPPNAQPGTLFGRPIFFSEFMPDVGAGTKPILLGDFGYYVIAERTEMRILRMTERFAPNIGLLPTARLGGKAVRRAAFRAQLIGT